ncbi:hypothetical protein HMPREF9450_01960 [Alistipes indistinctus YIT 12060]|uniref:Uncharacterized protein n=1 Tax=Alistipes indistinctus YIT 12060 TaxID=742725 RepID=G5HBE5_9BACT|nr:hypothetical protein HMPREF9450_01960 [Alistipes indistinctus YIT 12060]
MTDCLQPAELDYKETYEAIKALNDRSVHYLIVTKSSLVADDRYVGIMNPDLAHIQISITSCDDHVASQYEMASPPSQRIKAVEKLQRLGFDVCVRLSPFIPNLIGTATDRINHIQCEKVLIEFLRVNA